MDYFTALLIPCIFVMIDEKITCPSRGISDGAGFGGTGGGTTGVAAAAVVTFGARNERPGAIGMELDRFLGREVSASTLTDLSCNVYEIRK